MPMESTEQLSTFEQDFIAHHGIKGQKWGVRRYQNADGTYTNAGKARKSKLANMSPEERKAYKEKAIKIGKAALGVAATAAIAYGANKYMKQQAGKASLDAYISGERYKRDKKMLDSYSELSSLETDPNKKQNFRDRAEEVSKRIGADALDAYNSGRAEYKKYWKDAAKTKLAAQSKKSKKEFDENAKKAKELNGKIAKATGKTLKVMGKIGAGAAVISQLDESRKAISKATGKNKPMVIAKETQKIVRKTDDFAKGRTSGNNSNNSNDKNNGGNSSTSKYDDGSESSRQLTKEEKRIIRERRANGESPRQILSDMGLLKHSSDKFYNDVLIHHGIKGQHWGRRRFQNADGTLTPEGERRYASRKEYTQAKNDYRALKREATRAKSVYKATKKYGSALDQGKAKADYQKAKGMAKDSKKNLNDTDIRKNRRRKALAIGAAALGAAAVGATVYVNKEHRKIAQREGRNAYRHLKKANQYAARQRKVDQMLENKANRIRKHVEDDYNNRKFVTKAKDVYDEKRRNRKK